MSQKLSDMQSERPHSPEQGSSSNLRAAVTAALKDDYEVLDFLAEEEDGALLCRDIRTRRLAIFKNLPDRKPGESLSLFASLELDATVPAPPIRCHLCGAITEVWVAPCSNCGVSISGTPASAQRGRTREDLFEEAKRLAAGKYELVGDLEIGKNAGLAYFGWRLADGRLAALRLERLASSIHSDPNAGAFALHSSVYRHAGRRTGSHSGISEAEAATKECPQCGSLYETGLKFCPTDGAALRTRAGAGELIGEVIADRYLILRKIDEGGMGHVYLAEHVRMKRKSAVKVMNPRIAFDTAAVQRFVREAESASRVVHPNVATIFDFGETKDGLIYLAMEYVEGETLQRLLEQAGALPLARVSEILTQVADGLSEAHALGIIHRDLKPRNIMIGRARDGSDFAKIVDFGIAKAIDRDDSQITMFGSIVGTPDYMSPEQLGGSKIDARSDIYSLGLIVYNMLTALMPFPRATSKDALISRLIDRPKALALVRPEVEWPPRLQAVLDTALDVEPESRYATARQFASAFSDAIAGAPLSFDWVAGATPGGTTANAQRTPTPIPPAAAAALQPTLSGEEVLRRIVNSTARPDQWLPGEASGASWFSRKRNRILAGVAGALVVAAAITYALTNSHESVASGDVARATPQTTAPPRTASETPSATSTVVPSGSPVVSESVPATPAVRPIDSGKATAPAKVSRPKASEAKDTARLNAEASALEAEFDETRAQILKARLAWKNDGDYERALPILKVLQKRLGDLAAEHPRVIQIGAFRHEVDDLIKQVRTGCEAIAPDSEACK